MPPRSGYELSDDPDDVGSESDDSASVGSGRGSTGGNTDDEQDTSDADGESGGEDDGFDHPDDRERRQQHTLARVRAVMEDDDDPDGARIARRLQMCRHQYSDAEENDAAETDALADDQASAEQDYEDLERAYQRRSRRGSRAILQINPALLLNGDDAVDQADVEWTPEEDGHGGDMPSPPDAIDDADDDHDTEDESGAQFDDDNLTPLERIFMYAKSDMTYHRVLAARCLYEWLFDIELPVAVECLLPLVNSLGTDGMLSLPCRQRQLTNLPQNLTSARLLCLTCSSSCGTSSATAHWSSSRRTNSHQSRLPLPRGPMARLRRSSHAHHQSLPRPDPPRRPFVREYTWEHSRLCFVPCS